MSVLHRDAQNGFLNGSEPVGIVTTTESGGHVRYMAPVLHASFVRQHTIGVRHLFTMDWRPRVGRSTSALRSGLSEGTYGTYLNPPVNFLGGPMSLDSRTYILVVVTAPLTVLSGSPSTGALFPISTASNRLSRF